MHRTCPFCNERINSKCKVCPICGETLVQYNANGKNTKSIIHCIISFIILVCFITFGIIVFKSHNDTIIQNAISSAIEDPEKLYAGEQDNLYPVEDSKYINSKGEVVFTLPEKYNIRGAYREGYMIIGEYIEPIKIGKPEDNQVITNFKIAAKISIIDNKGIIKELDNIFLLPYGGYEYEYIKVPLFHNGIIIIANIDGKYNAYNTKGNIVESTDILSLQKDKIIVEPEEAKRNDGVISYTGKSLVKTKQGELIQKVKGYPLSEYSENSIAIGKVIYKVNYFKRFYNKIIDPIIEIGYRFNIDKVYSLRMEDTKTTDKLNYIDDKGNVFLKTKYHTLYHYGTDWATLYDAGFHNGLALLKDDKGNYLYINKQGVPVIRIKAQNCYPNNFRGKLALIHYSDLDKTVYINYQGKEIYKIKKNKNKYSLKINTKNVSKWVDVEKSKFINTNKYRSEDELYKELYMYSTEQILY